MKEKKKVIKAEQKVYATLLVAGCIALASLTWLYGKNKKGPDEVAEQKIELSEESPVSGKVAEKTEPKIQYEKTEEQDREIPEERTEETGKTGETTVLRTAPYDGKEKLSWPAAGNILIPYSMDTTVYFETLDQYQCSEGLCIRAAEDTEVKAVHDGIVTKVKKDERTGRMITMDMGNGYSLTYGQLKDIRYRKGDLVKAGSVVGRVAAPTDYFLLEGSHLFVKMMKDQQTVNPADYFTP